MYTNNMPDASGCVGQVNIFCTYSFTSTLLSSMSLRRPVLLSIAEHHHHHYKITIGSPGSLAPTCGFSLLRQLSSIPCGSPSLEGLILISIITIDSDISVIFKLFLATKQPHPHLMIIQRFHKAAALLWWLLFPLLSISGCNHFL